MPGFLQDGKSGIGSTPEQTEMLDVNIDEANLIAVLTPDSRLSKQDFESAARVIDPVISEHGALNGVIIHSRHFPGWQSFAALCSHLQFVRNHHRKISRLALVTDSAVGELATTLARHFVSAEIRVFPFHSIDLANGWILGQSRT